VSFKEYSFEKFEASSDFKLATLFLKENLLKNQKVAIKLSLRNRTVSQTPTFSYFERLPIGFNRALVQYEQMDFAYTDWTLSGESTIQQLYWITDSKGETRIIQLF
jgi:CRISPR-associated protein Cas5h